MQWKKILPLLMLSAFLCPVSLSASGAQKRKEAAYWNQKGIEAMDKNRFREAVSFFERALGICGENNTLVKNLSAAYNNYGVSLGNNGDREGAKEYLRKALKLDGTNPRYRKNLANIISAEAGKYYKEGDYPKAEADLYEVLALMPDSTQSLILLGRIKYEQQDLRSAVELWQRAYANTPDNSELKGLLSAVRREEKVEGRFKKLEAYKFDIRFDKNAAQDRVYNIRGYLREAYRDIGRDFDFYPQNKIPVVLYARADFQKLRRAPGWVAGIYDGKIRLPVKEKKDTDDSEFRRIVRHEYTHAVIFYLTDGRCPVWFNEGLAKYEESKHIPQDISPVKKALEEGTFIPHGRLNSFFSLNKAREDIDLAYLEAYSFIEFVLNRWNFYVVRSILEDIKKGKTIDSAFEREVNRPMKRIVKEWKGYILHK